MRAPAQIPLPIDDCESLLDRFERRLKGDFVTSGLTLWTAGLRRLIAEVREQFARLVSIHRKNNDAVYQQLMALELEVEAGAERETLLKRIGGAKGLLAALVVTLFLSACLFDDGFAAGRNSRHRRRDEIEVSA